MRLAIPAAMTAVLMVSACATAGPVTPETALQAADFTHEAYCTLTPEARAEVRRMLGVRVQLLGCDAADAGHFPR